MPDPAAQSMTGADVMREFVPASPYVLLLGISLDDIAAGRATLTMPYRPELATMADVVHGALASLLDITAMAAAWSDAEIPANMRVRPSGSPSATWPRPAGRTSPRTARCCAGGGAWSTSRSRSVRPRVHPSRKA
jgi:hypothetical protein